MLPANVTALPAGRNIIAEITDKLIPDGFDFSRNIVIFPNKRPAHFLRKELAHKTNTAFIPPQIFSIDEFIDYIYEMEHKDTKLDTIDAIAILYDLHKKSHKRFGTDDFLQLESFFPLGLKIYNDIEELYIEGISVSQAKNIDHFIQDISAKALENMETLSYFYGEFYKAIGNFGYSTRSSRYRTAAEQIKTFESESFDKIILSGFFALTKSETELFRTILSWDNSLLIFKDGTGIDEKLKEIGIDFKSSISESREANIKFYSSPDSHGQIFGLSRLIKDEIDKGSSIDEKSVIVVPSSDNLFPLMHNCLSLLDQESYNISTGYPLYRTPIFGFLNNLMELRLSMNEDKIYLPNYIKFVLHPYTKNIHLKNQPELTRIIFHTIEEELSENKTMTFLSLEQIENNEKILSKTLDKLKELDVNITKELITNHLKQIHQNTIGKFESLKNIGDFANKCIELLTYIYDHSTARLHPLFYPFSEAFILTLGKISSSLIRELSFHDINGYFIFFRKYILTCNAPFEGAPIRGLQILGFLETRNLTFENIYIIDLNEGILPAINKGNSLIPFAIRKGLGLPTYIDSDKISEYYFEILLGGTKQAHIFFIENDEMEKSRFIEKILWQRQKRDLTKDDRGYIKPIQYQITLKNPAPQEIKKTDRLMQVLKDFKFTSSSLDTYLKCGLAFYYNYALNIHKKEDIKGDIERSDIGIFIHNLLGNYFKKFKGQVLNEKSISITKIKNLLDSMYEQKFGNDIFGTAYLIKEQIKSHLSDLLKNYYIPLLEKHTVWLIDCEHKVSTKFDSYLLEGRIDSIEKRDGETVIIDYKTSSSENYYKINFEKLDLNDRDSWREAIGSIQLPFYMLIYSEDKKFDISNINAMFLLLGKNVIDKNIELPFCDDENCTIENFELLRAIIFKLIEEINDPNLPFAPPRNLKKSCLFCDYKNLCGRQ